MSVGRLRCPLPSHSRHRWYRLPIVQGTSTSYPCLHGAVSRTPPGAAACTQVRDSDHGGCDDQQVDIDRRMPTHAACLDRECAPRHSDHTEAASTACVT